MYGQHPKVLQDAVKKLGIELPRPGMRMWEDFRDWVYEAPDEMSSIFFGEGKKPTDDFFPMIEYILYPEGKSNRMADVQRKGGDYQERLQELAKRTVELYQDFQNKGKTPAQSHELDQ